MRLLAGHNLTALGAILVGHGLIREGHGLVTLPDQTSTGRAQRGAGDNAYLRGPSLPSNTQAVTMVVDVDVLESTNEDFQTVIEFQFEHFRIQVDGRPTERRLRLTVRQADGVYLFDNIVLPVGSMPTGRQKITMSATLDSDGQNTALLKVFRGSQEIYSGTTVSSFFRFAVSRELQVLESGYSFPVIFYGFEVYAGTHAEGFTSNGDVSGLTLLAQLNGEDFNDPGADFTKLGADLFTITPAVGDDAAANAVSSVTQGSVVYTFANPVPARQSLDGAWVVQGPVTVTSVTPASTGSGADMRSGSVLNPIFERDPNHAGQAWDGRDVSTFNAASAVNYPVTLIANDVLVKGVSEPAAVDDRDGWLSEVSALYVVDDLNALPAGDFLSASPIGWTGRGALEFVPCNPEAAVAALTTMDTTAHANAVDYAEVSAKINRWQGLAAYDDGASAGGYQAWFTYLSGSSGSNYGQFVYVEQEEAFLGLIGQTWSADQKRALMISLAQIGVHLIQVGRGFGDVKDGDGGHHQWQLPAAIMAMMSCPGFVTSDELYDTITTGQLRQSFIFDEALLARLQPHTNDTDPMDARIRTMDAINGNVITADFALGGERYRWDPSEAKKVVTATAESRLVPDQNVNTLSLSVTEFEVEDASVFNEGDPFWIEPVVPFNIGDPAWTIRDLNDFATFDFSPNPQYVQRNNQNIGLVLFILAAGLGDEPAFAAFIRYQEARVYGWRDYPEPFETRWSEDFWNAYGTSLFESTIGISPLHFPLYGPAQRFRITPQNFSTITLPDSTTLDAVGIYTSGRLVAYITDAGTPVVLSGEDFTLTPDVGDSFVLSVLDADGDPASLPVQIAEGGALVAELEDAVVEPPVSNRTVILAMAQSQLDRLISNAAVYGVIDQPQNIPNPPNVMIMLDNSDDPTTPPVVVEVTQANVDAGMVNPTVANWSVFWHRVMPGHEFRIVDCAIPGTSMLRMFQNDYALIDDGSPQQLKKMIDACNAHPEFGEPTATGLIYMANDGSTAKQWPEEWFPGFFGERWGGEAFALDSVNPDSSDNPAAEINQILWDITAPPGEKGRGLLTDRTKLYFGGLWTFSGAPTAPNPPLLNSNTEADNTFAPSYPNLLDMPARARIDEVMSDPRIARLKGEVLGASHIADMDGGTHGDRFRKEGQIYAGMAFQLIALHAAGYTVEDPKAVSAVIAPDRTYMDIKVSMPNGGDANTLRSLYNIPAPAVSAPHQQPVLGFEFARNDDTFNVRRPAVTLDQTDFPEIERGTVVLTDPGSGTPRLANVRYTPLVPFEPLDTVYVDYLRGDASMIFQKPRDVDAELFNDVLFEHVPGLYFDPDLYPFFGIGVRAQTPTLVAIAPDTAGDTTAPDAPVVTTSNATTLSGTAEPGATVEGNVGSVAFAGAVDAQGDWSISGTFADGDAYTVTATDAAGNESDPATGTITASAAYGFERFVDPGFDDPASMGSGAGWGVANSSLNVDNASANSVEVTSNYRADVEGLANIRVEIQTEGMSGATTARARYTLRFYNATGGSAGQVRLPGGDGSVNHGNGPELVVDTVAVPANAVEAGIAYQRLDDDLVGSWSGHSIREVL